MTNHFLDEDRNKLIGFLSQIYWDAEVAREIMRKVQTEDGTALLSASDITWNKAPSVFWKQIIDQASTRLVMREFLSSVINDRNSAAIRDFLFTMHTEMAPEHDHVVAELENRIPQAEVVLDDTVWDVIARLIMDHVLSVADPDQALQSLLTKKFYNSLQIGNDANENLGNVIKGLKESRLEGRIPIILRALRRLQAINSVAQLPEAAILKDAIDHVSLQKSSLRQGDAIDEYLLSSGSVFIDRDELRGGLRGLLKNQLVLVVKGPTDSGKSYSEQLIRHVAGVKGFNIAKVTFEDATTPREFVDFLTYDIDYQERFKGPIDRGKWKRHASKWLVKLAQSRGGDWWFIIDGFNEERLDAQIKDVINSLALFLSEETKGRCRLVLLDYVDSLPTELGKRKNEEKLEILTEVEVREFFTDFFSVPRNGVSDQDPVDSYIEVATTTAWQSAEARDNDSQEPKPFMELLKEEVEEIINAYT